MTNPLNPADAELDVLSAAWRQPTITETLGLNEAHFHNPHHGALYDLIATLHTEGVTPDPTLVLQRTPRGSRSIINDLLPALITNATPTSNAQIHADTLRDATLRRHLLAATERVRLLLTSPESTTTDALEKLTETVETSHATTSGNILDRYPDLDIGTLLATDRPPRQWLIEGLIPAATSISIAGPAGTGKSLLVLSLSLAICQGRPAWAGLTIPQPRTVFYFDQENTPDDLAERFTDFGIQPGQTPPNLHYKSLTELPPLDTTQGATELLAILKAHHAQPSDLVIIDSIQRLTQGPENDADTMRAYYRHTGMRLKREQYTTIRLDNTGKDVTKGSRGTSSKRDDVDLEFILTKDGDYDDRYILDPTKTRLADIVKLTISRGRTTDGGITFSTSEDSQRNAINACKTVLDELGIDHSESYRTCITDLRRAGRKFTDATVRTAVRERKNVAIPPSQSVNPDLASDHLDADADTSTPIHGLTRENTASDHLDAGNANQVRQDTTTQPDADNSIHGLTRENTASDHSNAPQRTASERVRQEKAPLRSKGPSDAPRAQPRTKTCEVCRRYMTDLGDGATHHPGCTPEPQQSELPNLPTCATCGKPTDPGRRLCHRCAQAEAVAHHRQRLNPRGLPPIPEPDWDPTGTEPPPF